MRTFLAFLLLASSGFSYEIVESSSFGTVGRTCSGIKKEITARIYKLQRAEPNLEIKRVVNGPCLNAFGGNRQSVKTVIEYKQIDGLELRSKINGLGVSSGRFELVITQ